MNSHTKILSLSLRHTGRSLTSRRNLIWSNCFRFLWAVYWIFQQNIMIYSLYINYTVSIYLHYFHDIWLLITYRIGRGWNTDWVWLYILESQNERHVFLPFISKEHGFRIRKWKQNNETAIFQDLLVKNRAWPKNRLGLVTHFWKQKLMKCLPTIYI